MSPKAVALVLRLYPRAWRERYGAEFAELLTLTPLTSSLLVDLVGHVVLERARGNSPTRRVLVGGLLAPLRAARLAGRVAGYIHSYDDVRAVYGEDPNHNRDDSNVAGNIAANVTGGMR